MQHAETVAPAPSAIARFVLAPGSAVSLEDLAGELAYARISVDVPGAAALALQNEMPGRVRGALGDVLRRTASPEVVAGRPCPWEPASALDLLFRSQGKITQGLEVPKPFVLTLDSQGPDLVVGCMLFGLAADWAGQVGDALVLALREGVRHPDGGRLGVSGRQTRFHTGLPALPTGLPQQFTLTFLTPFSVSLDSRRHDAGKLEDEGYVRDALVRAAFRNLGNRISGIARWAGLDVAANWAGIAAEIDDLVIESNTVRAVTITRASRRQQRIYKVHASGGQVHLRGGVHLALPALMLGQVLHVGAKTAQGFGRYRLDV